MPDFLQDIYTNRIDVNEIVPLKSVEPIGVAVNYLMMFIEQHKLNKSISSKENNNNNKNIFLITNIMTRNITKNQQIDRYTIIMIFMYLHIHFISNLYTYMSKSYSSTDKMTLRGTFNKKMEMYIQKNINNTTPLNNYIEMSGLNNRILTPITDTSEENSDDNMDERIVYRGETFIEDYQRMPDGSAHLLLHIDDTECIDLSNIKGKYKYIRNI